MAGSAFRGLFNKPQNPLLAKKVSIKTPGQFNNSVKKLMKNGLTTAEKKALVLARTRASLQLKRPNLSLRERKQFRKIAMTKLPKISRT